MKWVHVFKSGNTHRITLPRQVCIGLRALVGDTITLDHRRDGEYTLRNDTYDRERSLKAKSKK